MAMKCGPLMFQWACLVSSARSIASASRALMIAIDCSLAFDFRSFLVTMASMGIPRIWWRNSGRSTHSPTTRFNGVVVRLVPVKLRTSRCARLPSEAAARHHTLVLLAGEDVAYQPLAALGHEVEQQADLGVLQLLVRIDGGELHGDRRRCPQDHLE